jgi:phage baseplate assembly protein gpV
MAGLGHKIWSTGDSVSAAIFQGYFQDQVIAVGLNVSARLSNLFAQLTAIRLRQNRHRHALRLRQLSVDCHRPRWRHPSNYRSGGIGLVRRSDLSGAVTLTLNLAGLTAAQAFGSDGSGVDVTLHSATAGDYLMWDASEEKLIIEGTNGATALDVTDGNVVIGDGTLTVGSDGAGEDVTFYSDTAGDSMVWDSSAEKLTITGTNGQTALDVADGDVTIADALTVTGTTTTYLNVITDSGTTRTPALTDAGAYILCTHGSGMTITLPQDSAVAFPIGSHIIFERNGAGTLTFAAGTGATVRSKGGTLTCADQYTTIAAVKQAANTWTIFGNIG